MASKFIALFALLAVATAQHYQNDYYQSNYDNHYHQPAVIKQVQPTLIKKVAIEHEAPANYEFNYDVHDPHTGDIKQQHEHAKDGAISGEYSLIDADGYRRIVSYTADDHHGFVANVRREPVEGHKIVAHAPVQKYVAQPIQYEKYVAPVQKYIAQPVVQKYVAQPIVQKYVQPIQYQQQKYVQPIQYHQKYVAPAPVVEKYVSAPVVQYHQQKYVAAAPVQKYISAPIVAAHAQPAKYTTADNSAHVSVQAPHFNYHY
jgi:hypothetical protein